jgi:hypothetical protein
MVAALRGNAVASSGPKSPDLRSKHDIYVSGPSFSLLDNLQGSRMMSQSMAVIATNRLLLHAAGLKRSRGRSHSSPTQDLHQAIWHKVKA